MNDVVIKVENLSKRYRLGTIGRTALHEDLSRWWARCRGRPDPTLRVDQSSRAGAAVLRDDDEHVWALRGVSFDVRQGEVLGIIGRNGAGKSTLLKILSRVTAPTLGCAKIKGRIASLLEVGTGFHPELTGRDNIYLNGAILGMRRAEISAKLDEIIAFSGVETYIDTPVKRYSSGMHVRLAFAVAAHLDPEILIVDEVLAVGDVEFQRKCLGKMQDVASGGRTVLFVSHNLGSIRALCRTAILMENGGLEASGQVSDVVAAYMERYVGGEAERREIAPELPVDAKGYISDARVYPVGGTIHDPIPASSPIAVEVGYVLRAPAVGVCVEVKLSRQGQTILKTWDVDLDERLLGSRDPGHFRARVVLPGNTLAPGMYQVAPSLGRSRVAAFHAPPVPLAFALHADAVDNGHKGYLRKDVLLAMPLRWETVRKDEGRNDADGA